MPPLNLLGDYGGGGMLLVVGILGALFERSRSGRGQVVDAAMLDGVALLTTMFYGLRAESLWTDEPGTNILDLGAPHYNVYETSDGRYVSVGAGEPQFYKELLERLGLGDEMLREQGEPATWAAGKQRLAAVFKTKTFDEWCGVLNGTNTCFAPVLTMAEAPTHPHLVARGTFVEVDGVVQPAAAPRFSRTPAGTPGPPVTAGQHTNDVLGDWGFGQDEISSLLAGGVVAQAPSSLPESSF
jgi:alpha-methylacyl-CoA racemase